MRAVQVWVADRLDDVVGDIEDLARVEPCSTDLDDLPPQQSAYGPPPGSYADSWHRRRAARGPERAGFSTPPVRLLFNGDEETGSLFSRPSADDDEDATAALFEQARMIAAALGGGVLDGLGAVGDGAHARHEHVDVPSVPRQVAVIAGLLGG